MRLFAWGHSCRCLQACGRSLWLDTCTHAQCKKVVISCACGTTQHQVQVSPPPPLVLTVCLLRHCVPVSFVQALNALHQPGWNPNGCSSPSSLQYMFELNPACNAHDVCYHCADGGPFNNKYGLSTSSCNDILYDLGKSICHSQFTGFFNLIPLGLCLGTVSVMAVGVNTQGHATPGYCPQSFVPYASRPFIMGEPASACNNMARC